MSLIGVSINLKSAVSLRTIATAALASYSLETLMGRLSGTSPFTGTEHVTSPAGDHLRLSSITQHYR